MLKAIIATTAVCASALTNAPALAAVRPVNLLADSLHYST